MAESTALDLITAAHKDLGVLAEGETLTAGAAADGLNVLNRLLDQWKAQRLAIYTTTRTTWTIAAADGQYTVGAGGNVNVARPVFVERVQFIDTSTDPDTEYPLGPLTEDAWAGIAQKATTSAFPTSYYYNPTYPLGTLDLYPVPTSSTLQGVLYAPAALGEFASTATEYSLPPGYREMLVLNLAVRLAPSYGPRAVQAAQGLIEPARDAVAIVKRANQRLRDLSIEPAALGSSGSSYNIYTE